MAGEDFIGKHADVAIRALRLQRELDEVMNRLAKATDEVAKKPEHTAKIADVMTQAEAVMDSIDANIAKLRALLPQFEEKEKENGK